MVRNPRTPVFILIALHELENSSTNNNIQLNEEIINEEQDEETNESDNSESDESDDDHDNNDDDHESESSDNNNNGEYEQLVVMQENNVHINNEEDDIGEELCNLTTNEPDDIQNTLFTLYNHIIQLSGLYVLHRIHHNHTVEITQSLYALLCDVNQTEYY
jgi:ABC-type Zn2+ transport system substrate-binding protein/surface adhesin